MTTDNDRFRYCVECGTRFKVSGRGRPPIFCPQHRSPIPTPRPLTGTCPECGATFLHDLAKQGKPFVYCPQHRGVLAMRERSTGKRPFAKRYKQEHRCNERCALIRARVEQEHPPSLESMGAELGITRERVRQLIDSHGWRKERKVSRHTCLRCGEVIWGLTNEVRRTHNNSERHLAALAEITARRINKMRPWGRINFVVALHQAGYKPTEIADLAERDLPSIYRWLKEFGFNPYLRGPNIRLGPAAAAARDPHVAHMYALGVSKETILETFGLKEGNLTRIVKEQGVKRPAWYMEGHLARMRAIAARNRQQRRMSDRA